VLGKRPDRRKKLYRDRGRERTEKKGREETLCRRETRAPPTESSCGRTRETETSQEETLGRAVSVTGKGEKKQKNIGRNTTTKPDTYRSSDADAAK